MNLKIFQTIHKPFPRKSCDWIVPVAVGQYNESGVIKDNTGDNISHLNPYYAEFTTMYWAWKNALEDCDAVGFYHYRRYLHVMHHDEDFKWAGKIDKGSHFQVDYRKNPHMLETVVSDSYRNKIIDMLHSTEVISGYHMRFDTTVPQQWAQHHPAEPFAVFLEELEKQYPRYQPQIRGFFSSYGRINWPVFIMRRETFLRFCEQLFPLLDSVFHRVGTPYDSYQNRYLCFLVERFMPLWYTMERINPNFVPTMTFFSTDHNLDNASPASGEYQTRATLVTKGF
jgi:hypothetical protein